MSGGAWEYVMGVMLDKEGQLVSGSNEKSNSNFVGTLTNPNGGLNKWTIDNGGQTWPDNRYYDTYDYAETDREFNKGKFGDATKELGSFYQVTYKTTVRRVSEWNADDAFFVLHSNPWFLRGAAFNVGTDAGSFAFAIYYGQAGGNVSFRVVLQM